ncbi:MAG: proteasome accessory factor PafA2 family protein [Pseudomonadota bacterium]
MSIPKVVGIEQEYAIQLRADPAISAFEASCMLINAYGRKIGLRRPEVRMRWDYAHETPYQDIRGKLFRKSPNRQVVDDDENRLINTCLPNGARLYTDHAHPEYSTPECLGAREALACDRAGELILREGIAAARELSPGTEISLYKNNTDYKGHSYGCHENYLMDADAHQACLVETPHLAGQLLIPFLVTRQVMAGAGKVGCEGRAGRTARYQVSQRADFLETLYGLETTHARPIINTREEHHADATRFRRLHLIVGDANRCEVAGFLKLGSTQIVLQMMEDELFAGDLTLKDPLEAIRRISTTFNAPVELLDGRRLTAIEIQRRILEKAAANKQSAGAARIPDYELILAHWDAVLNGLDRLKLSADFDIEEDPGELSTQLDWVLKLWLLNRYRHSRNCNWDHPMMRVLDLQYHRIDQPDGIFSRLEKDGVVARLLNDADIERFVHHAPDDTRAWFRSRCIQKYAEEILFLNWEVVGFDHGAIHRMIPLLNPLKGTRNQFERLFEKARNSKELISLLEAEGA